MSVCVFPSVSTDHGASGQHIVGGRGTVTGGECRPVVPRTLRLHPGGAKGDSRFVTFMHGARLSVINKYLVK